MMIDDALALIRDGRFAEATSALDAIASDASADAETVRLARGHRGFLRKETGQLVEALDDFNFLVKCCPEDYQARGLRAELHAMLGRMKDAVADAVTTLNADPMNASAAKALVTAQRAMRGEPKHIPITRPEAPVPFDPPLSVLTRLEQDPKTSFTTSILPEVGRFIYSLVRAMKPRVVVETGSYVGYSAVCIAKALEDNGRGHLHCFDFFGAVDSMPGVDAYASPIAGGCETFEQVVHAHLKEAELLHRVSLYPGDTGSRLPEVLAEQELEIDLVFIDGDHSIPGCLLDWIASNKHAVRDTVFMLHDTNAEHCKWLGPHHLMRELREKTGEDYDVFEMPTFDRIGLGLIRKRHNKTNAEAIGASLTELMMDRLFTTKHWPTWCDRRKAQRVLR